MLTVCLKAAERLAEEGVQCEVIDLRTLVPLDMETVVKSVRKTHRAIVAQAEWRNVSMVSELAARICEQAFDRPRCAGRASRRAGCADCRTRRTSSERRFRTKRT